MADERAALVVVGPVTWDVFREGETARRLPGGGVSFAGRVARAMGVRARVLTASRPDADLAALEGHDVERLDSPGTLTYEHTFPQGRRVLWLREAAGRTMTAKDLPAAWRSPRALLLMPLQPDDLDLASFLGAGAEHVAVVGQGLQRTVEEDGRVGHLELPSHDLLLAAADGCSIFLSADEVAEWRGADLEQIAGHARRVVITRGARGADVYEGGERRQVPAAPAQPVDTTGAGDVFATAYILALGGGVAYAERVAAAYAAAAVEVHGAGQLPPLDVIEARSAAGRAGGTRPDADDPPRDPSATPSP